MEYIAFDSHKHYTWVRVEDEEGRKRYEGRIEHERARRPAPVPAHPPASPAPRWR